MFGCQVVVKLWNGVAVVDGVHEVYLALLDIGQFRLGVRYVNYHSQYKRMKCQLRTDLLSQDRYKTPSCGKP